MHLFTILFASLVAAIPHLESRDDVSLCKAVLIALKASAFCSSFVPIKDVTSTSTSTGPTSIVTTTVCGAIGKRGTTVAGTTVKTTSTSTPIKCNVGRAELKGFACDIITKACVAYVTPNTVKTTVSVPGPTSTATAVSSCLPTSCATGSPGGTYYSIHDPSECTSACSNSAGCLSSYVSSSGCVLCFSFG